MMDQMCNGNVFAVGRVIRIIHEVGLHARAVRQWPVGDRKSEEWARVVSRYFQGRRLLDTLIRDFLGPIEAEIDAVSFLERFEMEGTLQDRLPKALAVVEAAQARGAVPGEHSLIDDIPSLVEAITTLAGLVGHVLTHFQTNPFPVNPNVGFGSHGTGGVLLLDARDTPAMIEHIRSSLASGAFSGGFDPSRSTVPSRDIPIEDRGRTNQYVGAPIGEIGEMDPQGAYEPAGMGPGREGPAQWLAIGMWAAQSIPQLVAILKQIKAK